MTSKRLKISKIIREDSLNVWKIVFTEILELVFTEKNIIQ